MNSLGKRETSSVALIALSALILGACSSGPTKPPADSVSTFETDEYGRTVKTTTIREVQPNLNPPPPIPGAPHRVEDTTTHIQIDGDGLDGSGIEANIDSNSGSVHVDAPRDYERNGRTHVRAPLVKVDTDDNTGRVHIKAPFVNINKNGHGDRTTIRIPGITIRGGD